MLTSRSRSTPIRIEIAGIVVMAGFLAAVTGCADGAATDGPRNIQDDTSAEADATDTDESATPDAGDADPQPDSSSNPDGCSVPPCGTGSDADTGRDTSAADADAGETGTSDSGPDAVSPPDVGSGSPPGATCARDGQCQSGICTSGGKCAHIMFVTSQGYQGDVTMRGADSNCASLAGYGTWKAILSASIRAKDRISVAAPIYNMAGAKIASGGSDLWDGQLDAPPNYDESGNPVSGEVWTGTDWEGSSTRTTNNGVCVDWYSDDPKYDGTVGKSGQTGKSWVQDHRVQCDQSRHVYCFQMP